MKQEVFRFCKGWKTFCFVRKGITDNVEEPVYSSSAVWSGTMSKRFCLECRACAWRHDRPQPRIVCSDSSRRRAVEEVKRHPVPPDRSAAGQNHERPSRDLRQSRQRLCRRDRCFCAQIVKNKRDLHISSFGKKDLNNFLIL